MQTICIAPGFGLVSGQSTKSATTDDSNVFVEASSLVGMDEPSRTPSIRFVPMIEIRRLGLPFQGESWPRTLNAGPTEVEAGSQLHIAFACTCEANKRKAKIKGTGLIF
jgi:hypothetical protein